MEYSPPPLFKQGASARAKVVFFALLSITLLIVDARLDVLKTVRTVIGTGLYPLQMAVLVPRDAALKAGDYFVSLSTAQAENQTLKRQRIQDAQTLQQAAHYLAENAQLRSLLQMRERLQVPSVAAEILYDARDAFTRKVLLDRGTQHGVAAGQPVLDDSGIVGQVTRVFPFTSEVTLLTDKEQAIPVQVLRNGLRSVAHGRGNAGQLELRFVPGGADIQKGDVLITSGVDGVYPAGLAVAQVVEVNHQASDSFAAITCVPTAGIDRDKHLLVLLTQTTIPAQLLMQEEKKKEKGGKRVMLEGADKATPSVAPGVPATAPAPAATAAPSTAVAPKAGSAPAPAATMDKKQTQVSPPAAEKPKTPVAEKTSPPVKVTPESSVKAPARGPAPASTSGRIAAPASGTTNTPAPSTPTSSRPTSPPSPVGAPQ